MCAMAARRPLAIAFFGVVAFAAGWFSYALTLGGKARAMPEGVTAPDGAAPAVSVKPVQPTKEAFEAIYREGGWGTGDAGVGTSGSGSTMQATALYRQFLVAFMKREKVKSVVDAGCGDWEFSQAIDWTGIDYRGYDIVESVILENKKKYEKPNIRFFTANIVEQELPPADLLLVKHVLQHISNADVTKFLKQLPKYRHALLVNGVEPDTLSSTNPDISAGGYRSLDPTKPPFNLTGTKVLSYYDGLYMHQVVHVARR
jgi:SAM-dependent methyltransferase